MEELLAGWLIWLFLANRYDWLQGTGITDPGTKNRYKNRLMCLAKFLLTA
jgi:hypothetical protein